MANKTLSIKLSLNDKQFQSNLKKATRAMKKFGRNMKQTGQSLTRNLTLPLAALGTASIIAFDKQAKAIAQVEAGIKSTGQAAGFTSDELQKMASDLQKKTIFGDEDILKDATAQLLTFTNITGEQFERTQEAALDLATRLDGDLKSASIQLGKALNDPVANLSALSRSGIQFSKSQKEVINSLVESGRLAEAQSIILDELEKQYGGSAEAAARAGAGGLQQLQNQFGDLLEQIGEMLLPIVIDLGNEFKKLLEGFAKLNPEVKKMIVTAGILAGALGPVLIVFGSIATIVAGLSIKIIAIVSAIVALGAGFIYVSDNFEAFKERFEDISWWKNTLIDMLSFFIKYNPFSAMIEGYNALVKLLGIEDLMADNLFMDLAETLKKLKVETKEYKNEFQDFTTFIENQGNKIKNALTGIGDSFGVGTPGGDGKTLRTIPLKTNEKGTPLMSQAVIPDDLLNQMEEFEQQQKNITSLNEQMNQSFLSFGNNIQGVFANALQSQDGFFKSFLEGAKQALKAMLAQIAAMIVLNALLGGTGLGASMGLKDIGGAGGIGGLLKGLPFLSSGGMATGATLAMVGEGPGTSITNPEVIAPLDKLKSMIGDNGGIVEVVGTISGQDILLSSDRARNNRNRTRGY